MKKKILIVSRAFYPMNSPRSFRTTELVKEFAKQGHEVTLLTTKNNKVHIQFEKEFNVNILDLKIKKYPIFNLSNSNAITSPFKRAFNRIMQILFEYPDIELFFKLKKQLANLRGFDLLISIAVPHQIHWGVARAWNKNDRISKIWAADCGDPFMGATLETFKKMFYFKYMEKWWCRKVDFITVPFKGAIEGYYKEFHHKIKVIPQGFNFEVSQAVLSNYKKNKIPTFAFAGGLIPTNRDPREFIEYLLGSNRDFKLIIYTNNKYLIEPYLERVKGKIELKDYLPRLELLNILSKMDFVLNINNNNSTQLPSKLIDYYLMQRPILSIDSMVLTKK